MQFISIFIQYLSHLIYHPSDPDSPRNTLLSATEEESTTLTCSSDANPPVQTYSWYEGAACLPSADKSFHPVRHSPAKVTGPGRTNTASSISPVENGLHCCVARNRHGSQSYSLTVMSSRGMAKWTGTELLKKVGGGAFYCRKYPTTEQTCRQAESKQAKFHVEIKSRNWLLKTLPKLCQVSVLLHEYSQSACIYISISD